MDLPLLNIVIRWLHILSACLAIGTPLFVRYILTPAAARTLDDPARARLRDALNARWRIVVYLLITTFILTGLYNFFVVAHPQLATWPRQSRALYDTLFGFKILLALFVFFIASALPGKSKALAFIRTSPRPWTLAMILALLVILMMSNTLRALRDQATCPPLQPLMQSSSAPPSPTDH